MKLLLLSLAVTLPLSAEWAQLRGPTSDGISSKPLPEGLSKGLKEVWKVEMTDGFSSFTVAGDKAYTIVKREIDGVPTEVCLALDANTGKEIWAAPLGLAKYDGGGDSGTDDNKGGDGPRTTPSIDDGHVYITDANLAIYCLKAADGKPVWSRDLMKENAGHNIKWQNAASPVIEGDLLYTIGGGEGQALLALNKKSGDVVWKSESDHMTHATPILATIHGQRQVIYFTQQGLVSVKPDDGTVLWRHDFPYKVSTAACPVVWEDIVYCSAGYGVGAGAAKITKKGDAWEATELFRAENKLFNHWSTPVVKDGYLYGMFSFKEYGSGPVACVDIRTGEMKWQQEGFGPGQLILAGDQLLAQSDKGEIVIIEAKPDAYQELLRQDVLEGKCWSLPVLANGKIYARSTKEAVCLEAK